MRGFLLSASEIGIWTFCQLANPEAGLFDSPMHRFLQKLRRAAVRLFGHRTHEGLTAVEYEAVCLLAYEGRDALAKAREQAAYCHRMKSSSGVIFWTSVADEVARRTGRATAKGDEGQRQTPRGSS
ncbi:hypothetical protein [Microvirga puerhi]|uniref:DUF982 domain-containing protein n=1 Tax=Microvirga puerhi TaxID=2876078 RepID=A0ABS7VNZ7_9HYPH|nr:hypothetical protein [Microvirga puerhi]MBZ6077269.1 hypothetical protein [Microvirga puerhi]